MIRLETSERVAPGLLTLEAWEALRAAPMVYAADADDAQVRAIVASGIDVQTTPSAGGFGPDDVWVGAASSAPDEVVETIEGSYELPGTSMVDLVDVMDILRTRCPWTKTQTHQSLSHYLLEETHETLEALDLGDSAHLREELGDMLMQVVFHARIAAEDEGWAIDEVVDDITTKLIRRNPHVFAGAVVTDADQVDANWQALKAIEKKRSTIDEGIAPTLPALAYADKVLGRLDQLPAETEDIGGRLLALVVEARGLGVNAEGALRQTVRNLIKR